MAYLLLLPLAAALVYQFLALFSLGRFFWAAPPAPVTCPLPGVTVFKPIRGLTPETRERLRNGLRRSPTWEIVRRNARSLAAEFDSYAAYRFDPAPFRTFMVPSALFLGSRTPPFMRDAAYALASALPVSKVFMLEGEGHGAMSTSPDLFVKVVYEALDWAEAQAEPQELGWESALAQ